MDCLTITLIIVLIVVIALFLYCMFTGKSVNIKGGHKVEYTVEGQNKPTTLHIHKFKELKEFLKESKNISDDKDAHKEAEEWVINCINRIKKENPPQCTCELDSIVDKRIEELITQSNAENQANIDQNP